MQVQQHGRAIDLRLFRRWRAAAFFPAALLICVSLLGCKACQGQDVKPPAAAEKQDGGKVVSGLIGLEQFQEAESRLRASIATQPSSADAHYLLAYTLLRENRATDSLAEYTLAAKLRTPSASDLKSVAMDYVLLESYSDAERWINRSVEMDPQDADAWYVRGRIDYEQKRYVNAAEDYERVLKLAPRTIKAEDNLGLAYEGLNRADDALACYKQAIAWQQSSPHPSEQPLLNLAILLIRRNDLDAALPLLIQAAAIAPRDPRIHEQLGQLYLKKNRPGDAQKEFQAAIAASPDRAALHFLLGQAYRRQGMQEQAKSEMARAAALSGTHSSAN